MKIKASPPPPPPPACLISANPPPCPPLCASFACLARLRDIPMCIGKRRQRTVLLEKGGPSPPLPNIVTFHLQHADSVYNQLTASTWGRQCLQTTDWHPRVPVCPAHLADANAPPPTPPHASSAPTPPLCTSLPPPPPCASSAPKARPPPPPNPAELWPHRTRRSCLLAARREIFPRGLRIRYFCTYQLH